MESGSSCYETHLNIRTLYVESVKQTYGFQGDELTVWKSSQFKRSRLVIPRTLQNDYSENLMNVKA